LSYARRYALAAAVGVVQDDDDANAAMPAVKPAQTFQPKHFSLADAIEEIQSSTTMEELQSKFTRLYSEAKTSKSSVEALTAAKDEMKEKLGLTNAAAPIRKYELKTLAKPAVKTEVEGEWK
jgi:hypothetical protein